MSIIAVPKRGGSSALTRTKGQGKVRTRGDLAGGTGKRAGLDTTPEIITECATAISTAAAQVGITEEHQSANLVIQVDSKASAVADIVVRTMNDSSPLGVRSGVKVASTLKFGPVPVLQEILPLINKVGLVVGVAMATLGVLAIPGWDAEAVAA